MSNIFLNELKVPRLDYNLQIGAKSYGMIIEKLDEIYLLKEKPDFVLVYVDTNLTLTGALDGSKLLIHLIHVEVWLIQVS